MVVIKRDRSSISQGLLESKGIFLVVVSTLAMSVIFALYHLSGNDAALSGAATLQDLVVPPRGDEIALNGDDPFEEQIKASLSYVQSIEKIGRKLVFYHIPKTAGTAIEYASGTKHIPWGSCLFNHKPKRDICDYPGNEECMCMVFLDALQIRQSCLF